MPDGFVRDGDAALREEVFDVAEAESKPVAKPDRVADDRGREPVAGITDDTVGHSVIVPAVASS